MACCGGGGGGGGDDSSGGGASDGGISYGGASDGGISYGGASDGGISYGGASDGVLICVYCSTKVIKKEAKRCSICLVIYCNRICQKAHWSVHKSDCKIPTSSKPVAPDEQKTCSICSTEIYSHDLYNLSCGHTFHQECIKGLTNLTSSTNCPHCSAVIKSDNKLVLEFISLLKEPTTSKNISIKKDLIARIKLLFEKTNDILLCNILGTAAQVGFCTKINSELAITYFKQAIKLEPTNLSAYGNIANLYLNMHNYEKARKYYIKLFSRDPDWKCCQARLNYATLLCDTEFIQEAENLLIEVIKRDPTNYKGHAKLATIYANTKREDLAKTHFKIALVINPNCAVAHYYMSFYHIKEKDIKSGLDSYSKAVKLQPEDIDKRISFCLEIVKLEEVKYLRYAISELKKLLIYGKDIEKIESMITQLSFCLRLF